MAYQRVHILEHKQVADGIFSMTVPADEPARAGQFYMLRRTDSQVLLPRAISVCDRSPGRLRFLYQVVGSGTEGFSRLREGDEICITGPLGNGFPMDELERQAPAAPCRIALVGGGIGVAPLLYTARVLKEKGIPADCLAGFRDEPFLLDELGQVCGSVAVSTESGRTGHKGYVTALLEPAAYDVVLVCGPEPMMKAAVALCKNAGTPVYVSLENKMACGLGACLVCTCTDKQGKNRRTCKEGPVFRGEEIDFDA